MQAEAINYIKFGIISPEESKKLSVAKLTVPDTYNEDGYPIDGGLLDQRLGVIDPGLICKTCGGRAKTCPGHFGHIDLVRPVIHSEFSKVVYNILQSVCYECHRILIDEKHIQKIKEDVLKNDVEVPGEVKEPITESEQAVKDEEEHKNRASAMQHKKIKTSKKCPYCGAVQPKIRFSQPTYFTVGDRKLKPDEIREMLSKISAEDLKIIGIEKETSNPSWLILNTLLVPPVNVRPSITLESGERSEDDLTHKLVDIMRINQRLEQNINAGAPQIIIDDLWELLQYHLTAYFNNETSGIPPARHRSGRALKTLAQRLKGKEGRFRYNLSGKRVNYSARTVISVDPYVNIDEVGVPQSIAERLTVPFYVTEWNIEKAREFILNKSYPTILNFISKEGKRKRVLDANKEEIAKEIKAGDILERQLIDGDIVLFNRQPTLHRISIMAHKVKVLPGKTFRINYCTASPYNADFDGDEMNLHVPQTLEAQAEARILMDVKYQIFSPKNGGAIIANGEDGITGLYSLTRDGLYLSRDETEYMLGLAGIYELPEAQKNGLFSGKDIFSMLLPKDLSFEEKTSTGMFKIKNGRLIEGTVTNDTYGKGNNLFIKIAINYGFDALRDFIFQSAKLADAYVTLAGVTVGVKEYEIDQKMQSEKNQIIKETFEKVNKLISEYKTKKLEPLIGYTTRESLERLIITELNMARNKAGNMLVMHEGEGNSAVEMTKAGSRGNVLNLEQMSMFLGQQATLSGGRIKRGYYSNRVLPHIAPNDVGPVAHGFITKSYFAGMSPIELFMHAVGSRGSEVYKALLTGRSGYLYRRLSNALQDYYVKNDLTVRDVNNNIIQTIYGADGVNPTESRFERVEKS
ncbi:MAG: DNA-directed RNA polymerase subunit A' [Candidatus Micrarchaeia archaeon]